MSQISVNQIQPRTGPSVEIGGLSNPTHQGEPIPTSSETMLLSGVNAMLGPLVLSGNATEPLHAVPKSQALTKEGGSDNVMTGPLYLGAQTYPESPVVGNAIHQAVSRLFLTQSLNSVPYLTQSSPSAGIEMGTISFPSGLKIQFTSFSVTDPNAGAQVYDIPLQQTFTVGCFFALPGIEAITPLSFGNSFPSFFAVAIVNKGSNSIRVQIRETASEVNPVKLTVLAIGI